MKNRFMRVFIVSIIMVAAPPMSALANDNVNSNYGRNTFSAGNMASVRNQEAKDVFAAGNNTNVDAVNASGNVFAAGNMVNVAESTVLADIFAAGQNVSIDKTNVSGNVFAAANNIALDSVNAGDIFATAQIIDFTGTADNMYLAGGNVTLNGTATGDVYVEAESITFGDDFKVTGNLTVKAKQEPAINGVSYGSYSFVENTTDASETVKEVGIVAKVIKKITSLLYWIPAMIILSLLLIFLFGKNLDEAKDMLVTKPAGLIVTGVVGWIAIPVAAVILAITVIGIPLAAIIGLVYIILVWAGLTFAGASLGRLVLPKLHPVLSSIIGVAILELVRIIPVVGGFVAIAADMYLIGYVLYVFYLNKTLEKKEATQKVAMIIEE